MRAVIMSLVVASGLFALAAQDTVAQQAEAEMLARGLTGTELILVDADAGVEVARGAILSPSIDLCTLSLMWTGGEDVVVNLGGLRFVQGDGVGSLGVRETAPGRPEMIFVIGEPRYAEALASFQAIGRICGSSLAAAPPLVVSD